MTSAAKENLDTNALEDQQLQLILVLNIVVMEEKKIYYNVMMETL